MYPTTIITGNKTFIVFLLNKYMYDFDLNPGLALASGQEASTLTTIVEVMKTTIKLQNSN